MRLHAEEVANAATHGLGLMGSLALLPILIQLAAQRGDIWVVAGMSIFALSLVAAYGTSVMYHAVPVGPRKEFWLRLDYAAVYFLIAGTYTPFLLGALRGPFALGLLAVVWAGAFVGIYEKMRLRVRHPLMTALPYLAMGWLIVLVIRPIIDAIGWEGFRWLLAGGLAYTVGIVFFACDGRMKYGHCVWHVFVLAGSACHVVAVTLYGIQLPR